MFIIIEKKLIRKKNFLNFIKLFRTPFIYYQPINSYDRKKDMAKTSQRKSSFDKEHF